jgi:hypothetical protein
MVLIATLWQVGYHSWVVTTEDEDILLQGGGPDDGNIFPMQSYRSELGGGGSKSISTWNSYPVRPYKHSISYVYVRQRVSCPID